MAETNRNRYVAVFDDEGNWEIQLPVSADLNDLAALGGIVQAIVAFRSGGLPLVTAERV